MKNLLLIFSVLLSTSLSAAQYTLDFTDIFGSIKTVTMGNINDSEIVDYGYYDGSQYLSGQYDPSDFSRIHGDYTYADFSNLTITGEFYEVDLSYASLENSIYMYDLMGGPIFKGANLRNFSFGYPFGVVSIWDIDFTDADLSFADLSRVDGYEITNFDTIVWTGANLYGAILPSGVSQSFMESKGAIFVVPEPSTYALILGGLALGFVALRRK